MQLRIVMHDGRENRSQTQTRLSCLTYQNHAYFISEKNTHSHFL